MSLLTIAAGLSKSVGLPVPVSVIGSSERTWIEVADHANAAGQELARRVDWGALNVVTTFIGNAQATPQILPQGTSRITAGNAVMAGGGVSVVRPLTRAEWVGLPAAVGVPRYFLMEGDTISFWPAAEDAEELIVSTQTEYWTGSGQTEFKEDDDFSRIDEGLLLKGLEVRWRRAKGMDYADQEAEYEATLRDLAGFDDRSRL